MIIVPDSERKFGVHEFPYLDVTIDDLFQSMIAVKRANCPNWTDETTSDFGMQLLWMFSVLSKWLADNMERIKNNLYISTTNSREIMRKLCELIDYQLSEAGSASVTVKFYLEDDHPQFTIYEGTKVATAGTSDQASIVFETSNDQIVSVGVESININCIQGETISEEILGSSDGSTGQIFILSSRPVIWHSEEVEIYDNSAWFKWTRVDNFVESSGTSKHYRVQVDDNGNYEIIFGDGTNGKIPPRGSSNIRATYRVGGGVSGNVSAGTITELLTSVDYVESVTNPLEASGGTDHETLEHAKLFAPAAVKNLDRAVTTGDTENLVNSYVSSKYGGVATSKAYEAGGLIVNVMVVPQYGGYPSTELKNELQNYLDERRIICTSIKVIDPVYDLVNITVDVNLHKNYDPSAVTIEIKKRLFNHLSPIFQDPETGLYPHGFGRNIYLSDLYMIIDGTTGVDYCNITTPESNVIVPDYEIADLGDITINVSGPGTEDVSYTDLRSERFNENKAT